jgi:DNA processing protein
MNIKEIEKDGPGFPFLLTQIPEPPKKLFVAGSWPPTFGDGTPVNAETKYLCVVGARRHTSYGREACEELVAGLKDYNICIVSGLALGIDAIAHEAALAAGLPTIAFPGSGLASSVLYPPRNQRLAERIVKAGGALLSEFAMHARAAPWHFPQRNRLMAGISHATFVIEAKLPSGTLITSKLAQEYNRDVFALPGSIFSELSKGPNMLISKGACTIRSSEDILEALDFKVRHPEDDPEITPTSSETLSQEDKKILNILIEPMQKETLIHALSKEENMSTSNVNIQLSLMELSGLIVEENGLIKKARKYP